MSPGIETYPQFGAFGGPVSGPVIARDSCIVMPGTPKSAMGAPAYARVCIHAVEEYPN